MADQTVQMMALHWVILLAQLMAPTKALKKDLMMGAMKACPNRKQLAQKMVACLANQK